MVTYNQAILVACRYITSNESCFAVVILAQTRMCGSSVPLLGVHSDGCWIRASFPVGQICVNSSQAGWRSGGLQDGSLCPQQTCVVWFTSGGRWWEVINLTRALHSCCGGACKCMCVCVCMRECVRMKHANTQHEEPQRVSQADWPVLNRFQSRVGERVTFLYADMIIKL